MVIIVFALFDLVPGLARLSFDRRYLPLGGLLSGFFGGLSGNQGALRSAFLIKAGLRKEQFIGTGVVSAVVVDISRLLVYGLSFYSARRSGLEDAYGLVSAATASAFVGAYIGAGLMKKVTLRVVQILVGIMLLLVGVGMAAGLV